MTYEEPQAACIWGRCNGGGNYGGSCNICGTHIPERKMDKIHILYPEERMVDGETVIGWAKDEIANGEHEGPDPTNLEEAINILEETGSVTFKRNFKRG